MKLDQLTFFRFLAAFIVVIFHYGGKTGLAGLAPGVLTAGPEMVCFFFVLSGFIMIVAYSSRDDFDKGSYLWARVARILPVYLLALFLSILFAPANEAVDAPPLLLSLFFLQAWIPPYPLCLNAPGWSLSVEMFFYLIFPVILGYTLNRGTGKLLVIAAFIWIASQSLLIYSLNSQFYTGTPSASHDLIYFFPLANLNSFLLGIAGGVLYVRFLTRIQFGSVLTATLTTGSLLLVLFTITKRDNLYNLANIFSLDRLSSASGLLSPIFLLLIIALSLEKGWLGQFFASKPLVFLGEISYSVYILQHPLHLIFNKYFAVWVSAAFHVDKVQRFYFFSIGLVLTSALVYLVYEKPSRKLVVKFSQRFSLKRLLTAS